jgi:hypothetical protein
MILWYGYGISILCVQPTHWSLSTHPSFVILHALLAGAWTIMLFLLQDCRISLEWSTIRKRTHQERNLCYICMHSQRSNCRAKCSFAFTLLQQFRTYALKCCPFLNIEIFWPGTQTSSGGLLVTKSGSDLLWCILGANLDWILEDPESAGRRISQDT